MPVLSEIRHEVEFPAGVTVKVAQGSNHTTVKGPKGTLDREFRSRHITITVEGNNVVVFCNLPRREDKAVAGTYAAHLQNMIAGVQNGWKYDMKIVYNHFPIKASIKGNIFLIENFLGERAARSADILAGVTVKVQKEIVTLEGIDIQSVSQTAANIEQATRVRNRDIRVFQDGIYITNKGE